MKRIMAFFGKVEGNVLVRIIRDSFLLIMPFMVFGAFCFMLRVIPIPAYQNFIQTYGDGFIAQALSAMCTYTLQSSSLYVLISMCYNFSVRNKSGHALAYVFLGLSSYLLFSYANMEEVTFNIFTPTYMLNAILISLGCCGLFSIKLSRHNHNNRFYHYKEGQILTIIKFASILLLFFSLGTVLRHTVGDADMRNICGYFFEKFFSTVGRNLWGALCYAFLVNFLWFFGIHGNHVLTNGYMVVFPNIDVVEQTGTGTDLITAQFYENFSQIGGSGMCLSLIIALFLFGKSSNNKKMRKTALFPGLFNISEPVVYGLPLILNPIYFMPFVITPMITVVITYISMETGLVPAPVNIVEWTVPPVISGYMITNSVRGSILQIVNIAVGVMIYAPFVRVAESDKLDLFLNHKQKIIDKINNAERMGTSVTLLNGTMSINMAAKRLNDDMQHAIRNNEIGLYYQPQVNELGSVIGAEGLLRWKHEKYGFIYPPLVVHLATETGALYGMTIKFLHDAADVLEDLNRRGTHNFKLSINISPDQLMNDELYHDLAAIIKDKSFGDNSLAVEITERLALSTALVVEKNIQALRKLGVEIIMDDFGMGHSSMTYLQKNRFHYVKLDGALVKHILDNERSQDIIRSVCQLSESLDFQIIAEYVETEAQRDKLLELGCHLYQGYLYSPAIPYSDLLTFLNRK